MRRHFLFLFSASLILSPLDVKALYNGNPSFPMMPEEGAFIAKDKWLGFKIGYQFDCVYDRKLHMEGHGHEDSRKKVRKYESLSNLGVFTLNFNQRVELFSAFGSLSCKISQAPYSGTEVDYHSATNFVWQVGGRAILAYWGDLQFAIDAAFESSSSPLSSLQVNSESYSKRSSEIGYDQWQIGVGISYRLHWFVPYLGVNYSDFRSRIEHLNSLEFLFPEKHVTFKESYTTGLFMGFGLVSNRAFNVNFEARLLNENAISVSADFKF